MVVWFKKMPYYWHAQINCDMSCRELNINRTVINLIICKHSQTQDTSDRPKSGRPRITWFWRPDFGSIARRFKITNNRVLRLHWRKANDTSQDCIIRCPCLLLEGSWSYMGWWLKGHSDVCCWVCSINVMQHQRSLKADNLEEGTLIWWELVHVVPR